MPNGIPVSDVVNAQVSLSPVAAGRRSFGGALIAGDSNVIDTSERIRTYSTLDGVGTDFGTTAPEYLAASLFFSQSPRPAILYIGRWARTATNGRLNGKTLTAAQQLLSVFTAISSGGFAVTIDGTVRTLSAIDLSGAANLNAVAAIIQTGLSTWGTCVWDATLQRFVIKSSTTGATSTVAAVATPTALSTALGITAAAGATAVGGIVAETPVEAAAIFTNMTSSWYALTFAASTQPTDAQILALAPVIEASVPSRLLAVSSLDTGVVTPGSTTDIAYLLKTARYRRSLVQYSGTVPYVAASLLGRMLTVDFTASLSTITLKFKQEPGVTPELLTQTQLNAARGKNANVFVSYDNGTAILAEGVMADGSFIDEVHGCDWIQNAVQTDVFNLLYTSGTKIPQTESGINQIITTIEKTLVQAVENGLAAPGLWNADGFGRLARGDFLAKGFYVYSSPLALQAQADREARKAPTIQVALKLAGAVHSANVIINVNR